ncbi:MAG: sugar phosphate nucleotidyltransferase [Eubacteriales bacterium]|nr:sugar phosphate nucleotidyltransferase [Eubacteriales bacterium]
MNIILLSGGSGKRLWPLSNDVRSKQFLKIFRKADGTKESMAMRMYRMIKEVDESATITIATSENQIPQIRAQLGENVGISVEPTRRDTFPAIALAAAYLKKQGVGENEPVVVCPVDPYVESDYFNCLKELCDAAGKNGAANLTLMGIEPTYPSEKYGYIIPESKDHMASVSEFKEKPDKATAEKYIENGALWNGGVFAFKLSCVLSIARELFGTDDYQALYDNYGKLQKISFDYAVVEKEKSINVIRFSGSWKDLGTWNTLTEAMDESLSGNAVASDCDNTHVINELGIPIIALGIKDAVIAATPDGILVSDKEKSPELKDFVADSRPMYERRSWGEYKVLDYKRHTDEQNSLTKELIISSGQHISYQRHQHRTEVWTFTEGIGELILDDVVKKVELGDVAVIKPGTKHAIKAVNGDLHIIEVQIGDELTEDDIERLDWDWE